MTATESPDTEPCPCVGAIAKAEVDSFIDRIASPLSITTERGHAVLNALENALLARGAMRRKDDEDTFSKTFPLRHQFTPGLYVREIFMPSGTVVTSEMHKFEHPFVISMGECKVWDEENGWRLLRAPFTGITKPGTRRVLVMLKPTVWTTFHSTDLTDVKEIEAHILVPREHFDGFKLDGELPDDLRHLLGDIKV